jgi:hypothetical protein
VSAVLHRIEALPGESRYAVTFRLAGGAEQTAIVELHGEDVDVAEASLPPGLGRASPAFATTVDAVRAFAAARGAGATGPALRDVDGGWDVSLGNVVLGESGVPTCTAHGPMAATGDVYSCAECGAQARLG